MSMDECGETPLMRQREYRYWFLCDTSSQIGVVVGGFAFTLLGYTVTLNHVLSGLAGTLNSLVTAFMVIPGGIISDYHDRRRLIILSGAFAAALDAALALTLLAGRMSAPLLFVFVTANGALSGLFSNTTNVALPQVVGKNQLADATAANQSRDAVLQLAASPLAGLLYGVSAALPLAVACASRALQSVFGMALRCDLRPDPRDHGGDGGPAALRDGLEGARWYARNGRARLILLLIVVQVMVLSMCGTVVVLYQQSLGTTSLMLGVIQTFQGVGMLLGGVIGMRLVRELAGRTVFVLTSLAFVTSFSLMSLTASPWILALLGFCASVPLIPLNSMIETYLMLLIPISLRGRVGAVNVLFMSVAQSVSSVAAGTLLHILGYRGALLLPLAIMFVVSMMACSTPAIGGMPGLSRMDSLETLS